MTQRRFGYRVDPLDSRDRLFAAHRAAASAVPSIAVIDMAGFAPKDQFSTSSCVGESTSQALRVAYCGATGILAPELSGRGIYRMARNVDGIVGDEGAYIRSAVAAVRDDGAPTEESFPFSEEYIDEPLSMRALHSAYDLAGERSYHRIGYGDTDDWCRALAAGLPIVAGWTVSNEFASSDGRSVVDGQAGKSIAGGHAICALGYAPSDFFEQRFDGFKADRHYERLFLLINSWGAGWGFNGRFLATPAFVAEATDAWALDIRSAS